MSDRASLIIHDVPPDVRAAVEAEQRDRDTSRTNVVGAILADRYGLPWDGTNRKPERGTTNPTAPWIIRVPRLLRERLHDEAQATGSAQSRLIVAILAAFYGLPVPSTRDRRGVAQPRDEAGRFDKRQREE